MANNSFEIDIRLRHDKRASTHKLGIRALADKQTGSATGSIFGR